MTKKKKLNSKNPKYWDKSKLNEPKVKEKRPLGKTGKYTKFQTKKCKLIPIEIERLEYLISYCLKNYYIKNANRVPDGDYIPKWKYENDIKNAVVENTTPEVSVNVNGQRYEII